MTPRLFAKVAFISTWVMVLAFPSSGLGTPRGRIAEVLSSKKQFPVRLHNLQLRGSGEHTSAQDVWDVRTGCANWDPEDMRALEGDDSFDYGWEAEFTVFRHIQSGVAVEIVNDVDDEDCCGFFRFLSAEIFDVVPDSPHFSNFSHDCPGWVSFVNGHCTGEWLQAKNIYADLKAAPGENLYTSARMKKSSWTAMDRLKGASFGNDTVVAAEDEEVLEHRAGNWTVFSKDGCIFVQHKNCKAAQIILTSEGFVYVGCHDPKGIFSSEPTGIEVLNNLPHRKISIESARRRRDTYRCLGQ